MSDNNDFILRRQITPAAWQACLEEGRCFIVADASLNEAVPWLAGRYTGSEQHACLLWGETFRIHASAAPYCIPVLSCLGLLSAGAAGKYISKIVGYTLGAASIISLADTIVKSVKGHFIKTVIDGIELQKQADIQHITSVLKGQSCDT